MAVDPALGEPGDDLALGVEIVGLVTKMIAGLSAPKPRAAGARCPQASPRAFLRSAQASFPRPGSHHGRRWVMPLASALSIAFKQCHVGWGNPTPGAAASSAARMHRRGCRRSRGGSEGRRHRSPARRLACAPRPGGSSRSRNPHETLVSSRPLSRRGARPSFDAHHHDRSVYEKSGLFAAI